MTSPNATQISTPVTTDKDTPLSATQTPTSPVTASTSSVTPAPLVSASKPPVCKVVSSRKPCGKAGILKSIQKLRTANRVARHPARASSLRASSSLPSVVPTLLVPFSRKVPKTVTNPPPIVNLISPPEVIDLDAPTQPLLSGLINGTQPFAQKRKDIAAAPPLPHPSQLPPMRARTLSFHERRHQNGGRFSCGPCQVVCPTRAHYQEHVNSAKHLDKICEKPVLECNYCEKRLFHKADYLRHVNGNKHYKKLEQIYLGSN